MTINIDPKEIAEAAGKITDLWWARPDENGHLKTQAVIDILQKQFCAEGNKS